MALDNIVNDLVFELTRVAEVHVLGFGHHCEHLDVVINFKFCGGQ